jgi:hypothetical protein
VSVPDSGVASSNYKVAFFLAIAQLLNTLPQACREKRTSSAFNILNKILKRKSMMKKKPIRSRLHSADKTIAVNKLKDLERLENSISEETIRTERRQSEIDQYNFEEVNVIDDYFSGLSFVDSALMLSSAMLLKILANQFSWKIYNRCWKIISRLIMLDNAQKFQ